ncbi:transposase IS66, partial [gut metagenome]
MEYTRRKNPVYLSPKIKALVVYLNIVMCMPYNRIKSFLHDVMHIDISEGSIRNFIEDAGDKADEVCERIASKLTKSPVAGADESGFYVNGKLHWAWILQNPKLTLTWIAKGRSAKEMDDRFGENALKNTVLTTDRHSAYFSMNVKGHQICIAHLLRNLKYLNELDKTQNWSSRLQELLRNAVHWRNTNPETVADTS